ncbi:MAG: LysR family transcriptional regulator [Pseudomonadota bacterium]
MQERSLKIAVGHIKTRHLQLLTQLMQDGSLVHAAEALGMSQSAASKLLTNLENDVGVALFVRHARGVVPTAYGEILTRRAAAALAEIARATEEMEDVRRGNRVPLSIGSLLSPSSTYLPTALLRLAKVAPEILVKVHVDTSRALVEGLMEARFDLVVARVRDASLEPELMFDPVVAEPICVVARSGHPLAHRRKLKLADLIDQPWILPPAGADLRARMDALCIQQGLPLITSLMETLSAPVMLSTVRMSDALVLLPEEFARPYCANGWLSVLNIQLGVRSENFGVITRRHRQASPQVQLALEVFRQAARDIYGPAAAAVGP